MLHNVLVGLLECMGSLMYYWRKQLIKVLVLTPCLLWYSLFIWKKGPLYPFTFGSLASWIILLPIWRLSRSSSSCLLIRITRHHNAFIHPTRRAGWAFSKLWSSFSICWSRRRPYSSKSNNMLTSMTFILWEFPSPVPEWLIRGSGRGAAVALIPLLGEPLNASGYFKIPRPKTRLSKMLCWLNITPKLCPYANISSQNFHQLLKSERRKSSPLARILVLIEKKMKHFRNS